MYRIMIADDEFLARRLLEGYISQIPDLELVGSAHNGNEALKICAELQVDIALLDIHMPDMDGLEVARRLEHVPARIFSTAYTEHALDSYDIGAVDYLLKPYDPERFKVAIEKAKWAVDALRKSSDTNEASALNETINIRADGQTYRLKIHDIIYIEGQHEYVTFHTRHQRITALYALKNLITELEHAGFIRIHKSYIVNMSYIVTANTAQVTLSRYPHAYNPDFNDHRFTLPIGGSYKEAVKARL